MGGEIRCLIIVKIVEVQAKRPVLVAAVRARLMTAQLAIIATARDITSAMLATEREKLKTKQKGGVSHGIL